MTKNTANTRIWLMHKWPTSSNKWFQIFWFSIVLASIVCYITVSQRVESWAPTVDCSFAVCHESDYGFLVVVCRIVVYWITTLWIWQQPFVDCGLLNYHFVDFGRVWSWKSNYNIFWGCISLCFCYDEAVSNKWFWIFRFSVLDSLKFYSVLYCCVAVSCPLDSWLLNRSLS